MTISRGDLILVGAKTNGRCFYCNKPGQVVDHFVSRAKWRDWELDDCLDSVDGVENLFIACNPCNSRKSDKCPEDFMGNSYIAWGRYGRANQRVGLSTYWSIEQWASGSFPAKKQSNFGILNPAIFDIDLNLNLVEI